MDERPIWRLGASVEVDASLMVHDYLHLMDRALAGDFLVELPLFLAAEHLRSGRLIEVLPARPFPRSLLHLVFTRLHHRSAVVCSYTDYCVEHFTEYMDAQ